MGYCLYVFASDLGDTTEPEELAECYVVGRVALRLLPRRERREPV